MSLLRNPRGQSTNTLTVKRFLNNEAFSSRRVGSVTMNYFSREWVGLNNYYLKNTGQTTSSHVGFNAESVIIIRCSLATDAVGPIFGVTGKMRVMCESGSIKWYNDSGTVVHTVAIDGKRHDIGVYSDNGYLKPFYDGVTTANAMTSQTSERDFYPCILSTDANNGDVTGVCLSSASQTYAIKIHEIAGTFLQVASGSSSTPFLHYYACNVDYSETTPFMFETRGRNATVLDAVAGSSITGVTAAAGLGDHVTYGIQLHDLQEAFGTYYTQLMAVLCNDGGVDRGGGEAAQYYAGWDDPVSVNVNKLKNADTPETVVVGNDTFKSAFCLPAGALPSGATITYPADKSTTDYYDDGDLIRGRKPKWNLWADNVGAFKYVKQVPSGVYGQNYSYQMRYNIYKDFFGNNILNNTHPDMLAVFDGYSNRAATWHAPRLEVTGLPVVYTYNSLAFLKDISNMYSRDYANVETNAYVYNSAEGDGAVKGVLGNLPFWTLTASEQGTNMKVYGLGVRGVYRDGSGYHDIFTMVKCESSPLSSESSDAVKTLYKSTGETASLKVTALTDSARILADNGVFKTYFVMGMLKSQTTTITANNIIDCSRLVPAVISQSLTYQDYSNLMLIGQKNYDGKVSMGGTAYDIYVSQATADNANIGSRGFYFDSSYTPERKGVGFKFALLDTNRDAQVLFNNGTPKFYAYIEYVRMASDKSYILLPDNNFSAVDSKNDLPQGQDAYNGIKDAYIVKQGRKVFRRTNNLYNEVKVVSFPTLSDFPSETIVYKTTNESYDGTQAFAKKVFVYMWNQYINPRNYSSSSAYTTQLISVNSSNAWPTSSNAQTAAVYYKNYGDDNEDDRYYVWRKGSGGFDKVQATVVHVPNKESLPEIGDYYKDESTGKIYWNYWKPQSANYYVGYYNDYTEMTVHTSASKPTGTGSGGANIYYAQDSEKYYDYGYGQAGHYRYHEDEVVSGTRPSTGEVGKIYSDGGQCYRYMDSSWKEISPFFDRGEVIERRAMFAQTFAFDRTVWPLNGSYATGIISDGDTLYINKNTSKTIGNDDNTKYAAAVFHDQDLRQNADDTPLTSRYNNYDSDSQPRTMNVRLFETATAPHAWCVKDAYMSDKVENWMFTVGNRIISSTSRTLCYFLLSNDYLIANGNSAVVQASLGLCYKTSNDYESYVDLESNATNFMGFKLSLYKQLPTKPYVMNGNTPEFDSTHNTTTVFENLTINYPNQDYTSGNYTVRIKYNQTFDGFRMNASGNTKNGIFNEDCYYLEITTTDTIEPGATFLFKITAQ